MPRASYRVLADLFANHLHFTPTPADIASFERDLAVVSPSLMKASLIELGLGKSSKPAGAGQWRDAIYGIYNRKVAEHAQLFPMFHCFETAFRSRVAVSLEELYQIPKWWMPISNVLRAGGDVAAVTFIGVVNPLSADRRRAIKLLVEELTRQSVDVTLFQDGYELLEHSTMGQTKRLLESHWPAFRDFFTRNGQSVAPDVIFAKFERVRAARNAVYHHMSFSGMTDAYETAAELLGYINFPLPKIHKTIDQTTCAPPSYF